MLLGMAQKHRGIEDLLYSIMSFFERRTDLFHVAEGDEKKGFEDGKAEEMMREKFAAFQARYLARSQPHLLVQRSGPPPAASSSSGSRGAAGNAAESGAAEGAAATLGAAGSAAAASGAEQGAGETGASGANKDVPDGVNASPLDGGDPGLWERQQQKAAGFIWNQTVQEVTMEMDVEKCTAADIKVVFTSRKICVKRKGEIIVEGKLHDKINCEDSTWHLDSGKQLVLSLEKIKPQFWDSFFEDGSYSGIATGA